MQIFGPLSAVTAALWLGLMTSEAGASPSDAHRNTDQVRSHSSAFTHTPQNDEGCFAPGTGNTIRGVVTHVHDGDSITVADGHRESKVRLEGVDAPELGQPFGSAARLSLDRLLHRKSVFVTSSKTDRFGRVIGRVLLHDCTNASVYQVRSGFAWVYTAYQCEVSRALRDQLRSAEASARNARTGLWSQGEPQPPWVFRGSIDHPPSRCSD